MFYFPFQNRLIGAKVSYYNNVVMPSTNKRSLLQFPFKCAYNRFGLPGKGNTPKPVANHDEGKSGNSNKPLQAKSFFLPDNLIARNNAGVLTYFCSFFDIFRRRKSFEFICVNSWRSIDESMERIFVYGLKNTWRKMQ